MTFESSLEDGLRSVENAFGSVFIGLEGELESFFSEGAEAIATTIKTQLPEATKADVQFVLQSGVAAVTAAEITPGGGQAKMAVALASFVTALATKGIALVETQMRALLETTLLSFNAAKAAAAPATVTGATGA